MRFDEKFSYNENGKKVTIRFRTSNLLGKQYRKLNRKYFAGRLCNNITLGFCRKLQSQNSGKDCFGISYVFKNSTRRPAIFILWSLTNYNVSVLMTLLHEMVHLVTADENGAHGPKFHKEIMRLVKAGAYKNIL